MSMTVSFIIPHKGREQMLLETLDSIAAQDYPKEHIEVVVVSQNKDASASLHERQQSMQLTLVFNDTEKTISHSRNIGASVATGDYLAFLDADIALSPNWVSTMLTLLTTQPGTVLASAMQVNSVDAPPLERIRTALSNAELDTYVAFLPGRNLFLHRDTFQAVNGFPEHLMTCEDYYFTDKVNGLGKLYYTSTAQYVHLGEDKAYIPMFKKEIWRGQSNLASLSGRRIPLREWPSFVVPFAVTLGILLAAVFFVAGAHTVAALLALCGLIPLAVYSLRLKRLTGRSTSLAACIGFYVMYFPARALGTSLGIMSTVSTSSHK